MPVQTDKLSDALTRLIPQVQSSGDKSSVKSSGLIEGLNNLTNSLKSFSSSRTSNASSSAKTNERVPRTVRDSSSTNQRDELLASLDVDQPDQEKIFSTNRRLAQGRIDSIEAERDRIIADDLKAGEALQARTRALNVNSGLGGSDFAAKNAQGVDNEINKVVESRRREAQAKIESVLNDVELRSTEQFQQERATFMQNAANKIDLIDKFNENLRTQAKADVSALAANGMTLDELKTNEPEMYDQLLTDVGGSESLLNAYFASSVPQDQVLYEDTINGKFIQVIQDPVTGERKQQVFDLGEDFRDAPAGLKLLTKTEDGRLVFAPEGFTDPSQLKIYGSVGQFGKASGSGGSDVTFKFDTGGKETLVAAGFSSSDITSIQSDINKYGLDTVLEGMDDAQKKAIQSAIKEVKPEDTKFELTRDGIAQFLGITDPNNTSDGTPAKSGFLGFGSADAVPSSKETVDQWEAYANSLRVVGFDDEAIGKELKKLIEDSQK